MSHCLGPGTWFAQETCHFLPVGSQAHGASAPSETPAGLGTCEPKLHLAAEQENAESPQETCSAFKGPRSPQLGRCKVP
jgi:hypothetical protein